MKKRLSPKFLLALTLFSLIGQIAWVVENMYLNVFIYNMFSADAGAISLMVGASAVSAAVTTVFIGALSDKLGKRKVFMCGGYILWGVSILGFTLLRVDILKAVFPFASAAVLGVAFTIALDVIMTFFGSSANDAAFNAWLTDSTSEASRGTAEGINAMMPLVAILAVFGGFMAFDLTLPRSWTVIFIIIGIVVILVGILGFFIIKEPKLEPAKEGYFKTVIYGFLPSTIKKSPALYLYLGGFIIFNIAIQIFMPYLIIYYERSLGMENYVFIMAPAIIIASVATVLFGKLYDKRGFTLSSSISIGLLALGFLTLFIFKHTAPVFIGSLLMMCGYLAGMAVFGAKIRDLTPLGKAGMLQGVRIFSQVLVPGVVGPYIGKLVLTGAEQIENSDGTYSFLPNEFIFLAALITTVILAIYLITLFIIKRKKDIKKEPR
ncbi:MAG: MFS transporter [Clostridia bacterium]|nr:MFS transporter [Clostridia bacterium]